MVRPRRIRRIFFQPNVTYFKPIGIPLAELKEVVLSFDELESIRLVDLESIEQLKAGEKMKISQSTLSRLLKQGRKKLANAIIHGQAIKIQGGNFEMEMKDNDSLEGENINRRGGRFKENKQNGFCICPKCGEKIKHIAGIPCSKQKCPKCNTLMIRK